METAQSRTARPGRRTAVLLAIALTLLLTGCPSAPPPDRLDFATDPRILRGPYSGTVDARVLPNRMALAGDGSLLALSRGSGDVVMEFWDLAAPTLATSFDLPEHEFGQLGSLAVDGSGSVVAGSVLGQVLFWDAATGRLLRTFDTFGLLDTCSYCDAPLLALNDDGTLLAMAGRGPNVLIVDVSSGELLHDLATPGSSVTTLAFTAAGAHLGVGLELPEARYGVWVWDVADAEVLFEAESTAGLPRAPAFAFSADGRRIALASETALQLFDIPSGETVLTLEPWEPSWGVALNPDGTRAALTLPADEGNDLAVIDLATGDELARLEQLPFAGTAWSDDGRYLLAGRSLVNADDFALVADFVNGHLYSLELDAVPEYDVGSGYDVAGTVSIDGGESIAFSGTVKGRGMQRYLQWSPVHPSPAVVDIVLSDHPWSLHAYQWSSHAPNPSLAGPTAWTGYVSDASSGAEPSQYPLQLRRAP